MINTRAQRKLLHACIILVIVKQHLVQIGRIHRPTEYLSYILAAIKSGLLIQKKSEDALCTGAFPCNFHPSGWLRASALTCRLISLVGVKWSCLRIDKQAFPPFVRSPAHDEFNPTHNLGFGDLGLGAWGFAFRFWG